MRHWTKPYLRVKDCNLPFSCWSFLLGVFLSSRAKQRARGTRAPQSSNVAAMSPGTGNPLRANPVKSTGGWGGRGIAGFFVVKVKSFLGGVFPSLIVPERTAAGACKSNGWHHIRTQESVTHKLRTYGWRERNQPSRSKPSPQKGFLIGVHPVGLGFSSLCRHFVNI